jgi:hypothetical protein
MSFVVRAPEERFSTPPEGSFPAIAVDIHDLGMVSNKFDPEAPDRHMCRIVWQLDEEDDNGKPYYIKNDYTASLHEKAKLRKHLESWRGRAFTATELFGFDLETILHTGCLLSITHAQGNRGGTFANIGAVMKMPRGMVAPALRDYIRLKDRAPVEPAQRSKPQRAVEEEPPTFGHGITDEDVPFAEDWRMFL